MPLTPDRSAALFLEFARGTLPLVALAEAAGLSLVELIDWAQSPEIAAAIDALEALAHRHARLAAAIASVPAIKLLDQMVDSIAYEDRSPPAEDPKTLTHRRLCRELARKSANTVIALGKPARPRKPKPASGAAGQDDTAPAPPPDADDPTHASQPAPPPIHQLGAAAKPAEPRQGIPAPPPSPGPLDTPAHRSSTGEAPPGSARHALSG